MILSGKEIARRVKSGDIEITDFDESRVNPNSYNLRLAGKLLVYPEIYLDMATPPKTEEIVFGDLGCLLQPGRVYLGRTMEKTFTDKFVPMLEGRSSVGRLGLFVHVTAGFGDVGFRGYWTLELSCVQPIRVYPGVEICQIYFHTIQGDYGLYESGKYQNNDDVQPSMLWKDFEKEGERYEE